MKRFSKLFYLIICILLLVGCVDQNSNSSSSLNDLDELKSIITNESKVVATSVATLKICSLLNIDLVAAPSSDSYDLPIEYQNLPVIGNSMAVDIEVLSTLNADLVISPKSLENDLLPKYEAIGINYLFIDLTSVDSLYQSIEDIGYIFDKENIASLLVDEFNLSMSELEVPTNDSTVLVLMGLPGSYVVATDKSYVGSLVKLSGLNNIYGEFDESFLNVNVEDMLLLDPDYIFTTSHAMPEMVSQMFIDEFNENQIWQNFRAVKEGKVFELDHNYFGMSANFMHFEAIEFILNILE